MCTAVEVDGHLCETVGALAAALGKRPEEISSNGPEYCLCGVDVAALGGRQATDSEWYPFPEWIIETAARRQGGE
jgi:hypothetical protein